VGTDGRAFCAQLAERSRVVAIPTSVFYDDPGAGRTLVRFAFCKHQDLIAEAAKRLAAESSNVAE
jgi:N-succinyldiaminopimelate aminotransferase